MAESNDGDDPNDDSLDAAIRKRREEAERNKNVERTRQYQRETIEAILDHTRGNSSSNTTEKTGDDAPQQPVYDDKFESKMPFDKAGKEVSSSIRDIQSRETVDNKNKITVVSSHLVFEGDQETPQACSIMDCYVVFAEPTKEGDAALNDFMTNHVKAHPSCVELARNVLINKAGKQIVKEYYSTETVYVH